MALHQLNVLWLVNGLSIEGSPRVGLLGCAMDVFQVRQAIVPVQRVKSPWPGEPCFLSVFVPECHCQSSPFIPVLLVFSRPPWHLYSGLCHTCSFQLSKLSGGVLKDFMMPRPFSRPPAKKTKRQSACQAEQGLLLAS